jgi:hypothetical protein
MPVTSIETTWKDGSKRKMQFVTYPLNEKVIQISVYSCDANWVSLDDPATTFDERDEETFHRELRKAADAKGELVRQYSTDPEWTPGYEEAKHEDD